MAQERTRRMMPTLVSRSQGPFTVFAPLSVISYLVAVFNTRNLAASPAMGIPHPLTPCDFQTRLRGLLDPNPVLSSHRIPTHQPPSPLSALQLTQKYIATCTPLCTARPTLYTTFFAARLTADWDCAVHAALAGRGSRYDI